MPNFLSDYLSYATKNESPEMYHVWSGYTVLSAAIGRRVWFVQGDSVYYANIYALLVGDAGGAKSAALSQARNLLSRLGNVQMSGSVETPEYFCRYLGGDANKVPPVLSKCLKVMPQPNGLDGCVNLETHAYHIQANEFLNFISRDDAGWTVTLNDIYDQDVYVYNTKNMGKDYVIGPYVTLLGGIPTDSSKKLQAVDVISTGFARRTFLQYGERQFHAPRARLSNTPEDQAAKARCLAHLQEIQKLSGPMHETAEAFKFYNDWYDNHSITLLKRATPSTKGWLSSKATQVIKLAVLNSLSQRLTLEIIPEDYMVGLAYLDELEKGFPFVFGGVGRNALAPLAMKILEHLTAIDEPESVKSLQRKFFASFSPGKAFTELSECLTHLVDSDQLIKRLVQISSGSFSGQDEVYATPQGWNSFVERAGHSGLRVVIPTESPKDFVPVVGPSIAPLVEPPRTD